MPVLRADKVNHGLPGSKSECRADRRSSVESAGHGFRELVSTAPDAVLESEWISLSPKFLAGSVKRTPGLIGRSA